jgi:hypothetical protein
MASFGLLLAPPPKKKVLSVSLSHPFGTTNQNTNNLLDRL